MVELQPHQLARVDRLIRALDLTSTLDFSALVTPDPTLVDPFVRALVAGSCRPGRELRVRWIAWEDLEPTTAAIESLMAEQGAPLRLVIVDLSQVGRDELESVRSLAARVNLRRDPLGKRLVGLVLFALPDWLEPVFAGAAPDLWSVMTVVAIDRTNVDLGARLEAWWKACDRRFEELVHSREGGLARYQHGTMSVAYVFEPGALELSLHDLRDQLARVPGYTGWPPWIATPQFLPYVQDEALETWMFGSEPMFADPAHSDFWRASGSGMLYLARGYEEDSTSEFSPGSVLSRGLPIWRCAEALLHAHELLQSTVKRDVLLRMRVRWTGLADRMLTAWPERAMFASIVTPRARCRAVQITTEVELMSDEIDSNLHRWIDELTNPLFEQFDLHRNPPAFVERQLSDLRRRRT